MKKEEEERIFNSESGITNIESKNEAVTETPSVSEILKEKNWKITKEDITYIYSVQKYLFNEVSERSLSQLRTECIRQSIQFSCDVMDSLKTILNEEIDDYSKLYNISVLLESLDYTNHGYEYTIEDNYAVNSTNSTIVSFIEYSNIEESKCMYEALKELRSSVYSLLELYPTHSILQYLYRLLDRLMNMNINTPISVLLKGIETLNNKIKDWEVSAPKEYSLERFIPNITNLIKKWRKMELESWYELINREDHKFAMRAMERWSQLYLLFYPDTVYNSLQYYTYKELGEYEALGVVGSDLWIFDTEQLRSKHLSTQSQEASLLFTKEYVASIDSYYNSNETMKYLVNLFNSLDDYIRTSNISEFISKITLLSNYARYIKMNPNNQMINVYIMNILYEVTLICDC